MATGSEEPVVTPAQVIRPERPLVGRAREVEVVNCCLGDALAARGGALLVAEKAGNGKTRLAEHISVAAEALGVPSVWGRCVFDEGVPPFWPWRQILSVATPSGGTVAVPALESLFLVSADGVDPGVGFVDRFSPFEETCTSLVQAAQPRGLVVVFDDLHWADRYSIALLAHLARVLGRSRLLLVTTYRDRELAAGRARLPSLRSCGSRPRSRSTFRAWPRSTSPTSWRRPIARWHLLRTEASTYQGQGRFDEAIDAAEQALAVTSGPSALGSYRVVMSFVAYHPDSSHPGKVPHSGLARPPVHLKVATQVRIPPGLPRKCW